MIPEQDPEIQRKRRMAAQLCSDLAARKAV
jgi:hypothetical protein